jgi:hypothetical protein
MLPASYEVSSTLGKSGEQLFASSGCSDVWKVVCGKDGDLVFSVKSFRIYERDYIQKIRWVRAVRPLRRFS